MGRPSIPSTDIPVVPTSFLSLQSHGTIGTSLSPLYMYTCNPTIFSSPFVPWDHRNPMGRPSIPSTDIPVVPPSFLSLQSWDVPQSPLQIYPSFLSHKSHGTIGTSLSPLYMYTCSPTIFSSPFVPWDHRNPMGRPAAPPPPPPPHL